MRGIIEIFKLLGVTREAIADSEFFDYQLWHEGAEYSIRFETYGEKMVGLSLRHYGTDMWQNRHVFGELNQLINVLSTVENSIFYDRKIAFWRKPQALWKAFEAALDKEKTTTN